MNRMSKIIVVMMGASLLSAGVLAAGLGTAGTYNTFIFEDFSSKYSDTWGRMAVGGNASLEGYGVGTKLTPGQYEEVLVVGGNLSYKNGQVYSGNAVVGGTATLDQNVNIKDGVLIQGQGVPVDFAAERAYLESLSENLSLQAQTGTVKYEWGNLHLKGDQTSNFQVFNLDGDQLLSSNWFNFDVTSIPQDATVVFNISGGTAGLKGGLQNLASINSKVLFNFYEATTLQLSNVGVEGSILAPFAHVENPTGQINGTIIAKSWNGMMEQHDIPFDGELPPVTTPTPIPTTTPPPAVPEPTTLILLGFGVMALFGLGRKHRK